MLSWQHPFISQNQKAIFHCERLKYHLLGNDHNESVWLECCEGHRFCHYDGIGFEFTSLIQQTPHTGAGGQQPVSPQLIDSPNTLQVSSLQLWVGEAGLGHQLSVLRDQCLDPSYVCSLWTIPTLLWPDAWDKSASLWSPAELHNQILIKITM